MLKALKGLSQKGVVTMAMSENAAPPNHCLRETQRKACHSYLNQR